MLHKLKEIEKISRNLQCRGTSDVSSPQPTLSSASLHSFGVANIPPTEREFWVRVLLHYQGSLDATKARITISDKVHPELPKPQQNTVENWGIAVVVRNTGATLRTGVDIDASVAVGKLPYGARVYFDAVVELDAIVGETLPATRLRIIQRHKEASEELHFQMLEPVDGGGVVGWVSVAGRTIEDSDPIMSILAFPKNYVPVSAPVQFLHRQTSTTTPQAIDTVVRTQSVTETDLICPICDADLTRHDRQSRKGHIKACSDFLATLT